MVGEVLMCLAPGLHEAPDAALYSAGLESIGAVEDIVYQIALVRAVAVHIIQQVIRGGLQLAGDVPIFHLHALYQAGVEVRAVFTGIEISGSELWNARHCMFLEQRPGLFVLAYLQLIAATGLHVRAEYLKLLDGVLHLCQQAALAGSAVYSLALGVFDALQFLDGIFAEHQNATGFFESKYNVVFESCCIRIFFLEFPAQDPDSETIKSLLGYQKVA